MIIKNRKFLKRFNILTILLIVNFSTGNIFSQSLVQEEAKTHLRWNIFSKKNRLSLIKTKGFLIIKSLDRSVLTNVYKELKDIKLNLKYITRISNIYRNKDSGASEIKITLASDNIELFNYYKDSDRKFIVDFWQEEDDAIESSKFISKTKSKAIPKISLLKKKRINKKRVKKNPIIKKKSKKKSPYRSFRYGAAFIWDYPAMVPEFKKYIDIKNKTPEYFYPVRDLNYTKHPREAHLQLAVKFYRKKKWGLMNKSIKLFIEEYGEKDHAEFLAYLKANALAREGLTKNNKSILKSAQAAYESLVLSTKNYDLKKAIMKYLIAYDIEKEDYVSMLKKSKLLYVESKENLDYEEIKNQSLLILKALSHLKQIDKIQKLLKEKDIKNKISAQKRIAYQIYVYIELGYLDKVLDVYNKNYRSFKGKIEPSILFNVGEAYFRKARFEESYKIFDTFISQYSYHLKSSQARLRIALAYDLLDRPVKQVLALYKFAINRSSIEDVLLESKIRYVALSSVRKRNPTKKDIEERVFLDFVANKGLGSNENLKKIFWLTRLRIFSNDKKYLKGLTYLSLLPLATMKPLERKVFEAEGAVNLSGVINNRFNKGEYSYVIKYWNTWKGKYIDKVAYDPHINYIVGMSYLNLGLMNSFDTHLESFKKLKKSPRKTFPIWQERKKIQNIKDLIVYLEIEKNIKLENYELVFKKLEKLKKLKDIRLNYWFGLVFYKKKKYREAIKKFESFLIKKI